MPEAAADSRRLGTLWQVPGFLEMSLYYFDIQFENSARSIDEEGESHPNVDAARVEAGLILTGLAREMLQSGKIISGITIWVRDEIGEVMCAKLAIQMMRFN